MDIDDLPLFFDRKQAVGNHHSSPKSWLHDCTRRLDLKHGSNPTQGDVLRTSKMHLQLRLKATGVDEG